MSDIEMDEVELKARAAKRAAQTLGTASSDAKNRALGAIAERLSRDQDAILAANRRDTDAGRAKGLTEAMVERLTLTPKRIAAMQEGLRQVASLPDPVGEVLSGQTRPNGLQITKIRVPLGVIGIIYESRPNVTVDAAALCIKSGNAVVLRGGSEAIHSNRALTECIRAGLDDTGLPEDCVSLIMDTDRAAARRLMTLNGLVDCLIPRGGAALIRTVVETATVPVIETGVGNCHVFVNADANLEMAARIVVNAKTQRPSVCNAAESLLVHRAVASEFLPMIGEQLRRLDVEIRADEDARAILSYAKPTTEEDWFAEYLSLTLAIKVADDLDAAIEHINHYGSHHSDAIITRSYDDAQRFIARVDSAAVYVNASTRFTDGFEFGLGAEIGISTQKLHARGPMGLTELTTCKHIVRGSGQIRE